MYDKFFISVTSHALDSPPSVTNCHTFSDLLPPRAWRTLWTAPFRLCLYLYRPHIFVCSHIDYSNSLYSLASIRLSSIQIVLNASAWLIARLPHLSHISSFMTLNSMRVVKGSQWSCCVKVIFLAVKTPRGSAPKEAPWWSNLLSLLPLSALSALPNAMIFSFLVLGHCPLLLLVRHSGIAFLLLFVRLFSLLPFSRLSLALIKGLESGT